ncbi:MAG: flavodoxin-dependent (E)-4-hydroxy-3-methylbut-2-enyl-diphosphate synthase [Candidatus Omnitrophica bacterium]|nr:flavodoxin-dependent (E)-4-hydroxy-3-methylbut-2-enyl-diphosphate synthase [Candidatus Omnitrophota bacterium]
MIKRRRTKTVSIGAIKIGGRNPISIQSMTKTDTANLAATIRQIKALERCGCEVIRVAVKNMSGATVLGKIKTKIHIPLVADIHFNYRLALQALACGVDGLRLNPGNIYRPEEVKQVAKACKRHKIPIRVGVNSGSLRSSGHNSKPTEQAERMAKSALGYIEMLERFNFYDIIVSLKSSDVATTVNAYRKLASRCHYPFHVGITACGLSKQGVVKSAIGIGSLLLEGIGDTIRVSLTGAPEEEVAAAKMILQALGLRNFGPEIIACPTCGRCKVDLVKISRQVEQDLLRSQHSLFAKRGLKVAIMGCEVNGPGEAAEADIGVACGANSAVLFRKGKLIKRVKATAIADTLIDEVKNALE